MEDIKKLRELTSAGFALCKEALESSDGDMQKAIEFINAKSDAVGRLRNMTGVKIGLAKIALQDADGDFQKALEIIRERGWDTDDVDAAPGAEGEGCIGSYIHGTDRKTAALVEVRCKTDFVAKNQDFIDFANELAKQAAAMKPKYVSMDQVPEKDKAELMDLFKREVMEEGKPENIAEKIIAGKLEKYAQENCLLDQKWFKDESKTMKMYLDETSTKLGEPIEVTKLTVWVFGKK